MDRSKLNSRVFSVAALCAPALLSVLTACNTNDGAAAATNSGRGGRGETVLAVETQPVQVGEISRSVSVSGAVEPIRMIGVNSQIAGALRDVAVEEGNVVNAGTVLATLDDREIAAQLRSAEAGLTVAQSAFDRSERLRERQVITVAEYERDRAALEAAKAQVDQLRTRAGYTTVRAPIAGVITEKDVETGDIVSVQTRMFTIADISTMVVRVAVSELDVIELSPGSRVEVRLDAYSGQPFGGRVRRIFPTADPTTRLVPVEVALDAAVARIARPGFLARVTFGLRSRENVLLVPASAIVGGAGAEAVFVIEDAKARRRPVRVGMTSQGRVEVLQGLDEGEAVVTVGTNRLRDGADVRVVGTGQAAPPAVTTEGRTGS
jgi:RND family efflux transporter MFP subunit